MFFFLNCSNKTCLMIVHVNWNTQHNVMWQSAVLKSTFHLFVTEDNTMGCIRIKLPIQGVDFNKRADICIEEMLIISTCNLFLPNFPVIESVPTRHLVLFRKHNKFYSNSVLTYWLYQHCSVRCFISQISILKINFNSNVKFECSHSEIYILL